MSAVNLHHRTCPPMTLERQPTGRLTLRPGCPAWTGKLLNQVQAPGTCCLPHSTATCRRYVVLQCCVHVLLCSRSLLHRAANVSVCPLLPESYVILPSRMATLHPHTPSKQWTSAACRYGEISSASNCTDYQARRLNLRYRWEFFPCTCSLVASRQMMCQC